MSAQLNDIIENNGPLEQPQNRRALVERLMGRRWRLAGLAAGAAAMAAVASAVILGGGSPPVPAEISVREVINRVETDRPRGMVGTAVEYLPAVVGQELLPGDGLKTFADSEARVDIRIAGYTRVSRSKPNTVWRLGQFSLQEETIIELDAGRIFLFDDAADPTGRPFKVVTPAGTASPRGTWMSFAYDPLAEVAELQCFRGTCVLENDLGTQVLKDEEKSVITSVSAPVEPVVMTIEENTVFEELPEAATGEIAIPTPEPIPEPTPEPTPDPAVEPTIRPVSVPAPIPVSLPNPAPDAAPGPEPSGPAAGTGPESGAGGPDVVSQPNPAATSVATPVAAPAATPRPTRQPISGRLFNRAPTPTFVPARWPTPTPTPDLEAMFGHRPGAAPEPLEIPLPPIDPSALPHIFVGTVSINAVPAEDGAEVTVWTDGYSEPLARSRVTGGTYTLLVPQYGFNSFRERHLLFRVDNLDAGPAASWSPGAVDLLDLRVTTSGPHPRPTPGRRVR